MRYTLIAIPIVIFLLAFNHPMLKEEGVVKLTYLLTYQPDSTNSNRKLNEEMILYTNGVFSKFASSNKLLYEDSISPLLVKKFNATGMVNPEGMKMPKTNFKFLIFKSNQNIEVYESIQGDIYQYKEPRNTVNWEITDEMKVILGYNCQKAKGEYAGRHYTAWFTQEIPIAEGPYKFGGLPGLIIKIVDSKNHYLFELIDMEGHTNYALKSTPINFLKSTKEIVFKGKDFIKSNPLQAIESLGSFDLTPEKKREIIERNKRNNNDIELLR